MSIVTPGEAGANIQPSPSIWKDCPKRLLTDLGQGYYFHEEFLGAFTDTIATTEAASFGNFNYAGDADTVVTLKAAELGGYLDIETDADDNDAAILFTEPMARVDLNLGNKVWFEVRLEVGAVADQGVFVGFAEEAALTVDILADGAAATVGESYFGFRVLSGDTDAFDAAYKLDAGTEVEMLATVQNATALPVADRANLVADTEVKLGMKFDGRDQILTYVNGIQVAATTIASATFPDGVNMGGVIAIKTGTAAAQSIAIDWARFAYQARR